MAEPVPDGVVTTYRDDGSKLVEATYDCGVTHGPYRDFWSNGQVSLQGQYRCGVEDGEWLFFNPDGSLREVIRFENGREVPARSQS